MIVFDHVTDYFHRNDRDVVVFDDVSMEIPEGQFGLLVDSAELRKPVIDLLCGTRIPRSGKIYRDGRTSWAIGRTTPFRGQLTGHDVTGLFCRLYDLNRAFVEDVIVELLSDSTLLSQRLEYWPPLDRAEFGQIMALLPRFQIYVTDGNLLFSQGRFGALWRLLFEERIAEKSLFLSSLHVSNFSAFCKQAIIASDGKLAIDEDLERAMLRFPPRSTLHSEQAADPSEEEFERSTELDDTGPL